MSSETIAAKPESPAKLTFSVAAPPHVHCGRTTPQIMFYLLLALLPAAIMAVCNYGLPALRVMALSVAVALLAEWACVALIKRDNMRSYPHAALMGMYLAFLLPAAAPWWLVIIGAAATITLGKYVFGGLGNNPLCPPLVGWAILMVSWPLLMSPNAMQVAQNFADPLIRLKYFGAEYAARLPLADLFMGRQIGGLGATQILGVLIGAAFVLGSRVITWTIPLGYIVGVLVAAMLLPGAAGEGHGPLLHLLGGSTLFGAFFLSVEVGCSPIRTGPRLVYGFCTGVLVILIRVLGIYPDGVPFALLLANLITPFFDLIRPKPFGLRKTGA